MLGKKRNFQLPRRSLSWPELMPVYSSRWLRCPWDYWVLSQRITFEWRVARSNLQDESVLCKILRDF